MNSRMQFAGATKTISLVVNEITNMGRGGLDLQPKYQREYIWKDDFKDKLIYSIIRGYPIGNISIAVLTQANDKKAKSEVVDGQQRLTSIKEFVKDEYEIKLEFSKKISEDIISYLDDIPEGEDKKLDKLRNKMRNGKSFRLTYDMLPENIKSNFDNYNLSISNISESTPEQIAEYFRFLQNQEILRAGEIISSYPDTGFDKYLDLINDREKFLSKIGLKSDRRKNFVKWFYCTIGIIDKKLAFGSPDKRINAYVLESDMDKESPTGIKVIHFINRINGLCEEASEYVIEKTATGRFVKLLLLLLAFEKFDFNDKTTSEALQKLSHIESRLKCFSSTKSNEISRTFEFLKKEDKEKSEEIIEEYRQIANFCKGIQKYDTIIEKVDLLYKIIDRELHTQYEFS